MAEDTEGEEENRPLGLEGGTVSSTSYLTEEAMAALMGVPIPSGGTVRVVCCGEPTITKRLVKKNGVELTVHTSDRWIVADIWQCVVRVKHNGKCCYTTDDLEGLGDL